VFGGGAIALIWAASTGKIERRVVPWAIAGLVAMDLWSIERKYWLFSPPAKQIFGSDAIADYIRNDTTHGRAYALPIGEGAVPRDPFLRGSALMGVGVRQVGGYHGNELGRYQQLFAQSGLAAPRTMDDVMKGFAMLGRLTNLRWFYTSVGDFPPPFEKVLGPVRNGVGSETWLYRIPGDYQQAWVVPVMMKVDDQQAFATLAQADVSQHVAMFEPNAPVQGETVTTLPTPLTIRARVSRYEPGIIDIDLDAPAPDKSALLVSENFYPGWKAAVDGKPVEVSRANFVIMGVPLPAGARKVELRFTDPAYEKGKTITFIALTLSMLLLIGGVAVERKTARV
jgi:hypothetical protein